MCDSCLNFIVLLKIEPWTAAAGHQGELRLFKISSSSWKRKLWKTFSILGDSVTSRKHNQRRVWEVAAWLFTGSLFPLTLYKRGQRQTEWIPPQPGVVDLWVYWGYYQEHGALTGCYITDTAPLSRCLMLIYPQGGASWVFSLSPVWTSVDPVSCRTGRSDPSRSDLRWQ